MWDVCPYLSLNRGVRLKTAEGGRLAPLPLLDKPRLSALPPLGDRWLSPCNLRSSWMNFSSSSSLGLCPPWVPGREGGLEALWGGSPVLPLTKRTSSSSCKVPVVEMLLTAIPHPAKETEFSQGLACMRRALGLACVRTSVVVPVWRFGGGRSWSELGGVVACCHAGTQLHPLTILHVLDIGARGRQALRLARLRLGLRAVGGGDGGGGAVGGAVKRAVDLTFPRGARGGTGHH